MQLIGAIQVLRAVAALSVVIHHALGDATRLTIAAGSVPLVTASVFPFEAGVDLFFVISGFVMVYASAHLFATPGAGTEFLRRRIVRVAPLYWIVTTIYLGLVLASPGNINSPPPGFALTLGSYLFVPLARADGVLQPVYSLGWTLNYEMFFYVVFATAIVLRRTVAVAAVSVALASAVALGLAIQPASPPLRFWSDPIVFEFVAGMVLAELYVRGFRYSALVRCLFVIAALALLTANCASGCHGFVAHRFIAWGLPAALIVAASLPSGMMASGQMHGRASRWFGALGDASYALYLIHPFAVRTITLAWPKLGIGLSAAAQITYLAIVVASAVLVALAIHRLIERPILGKLHRS